MYLTILIKQSAVKVDIIITSVQFVHTDWSNPFLTSCKSARSARYLEALLLTKKTYCWDPGNLRRPGAGAEASGPNRARPPLDILECRKAFRSCKKNEIVESEFPIVKL